MAIFEGEKVKLTAQFTDDSGADTSPSTPVEISVETPDGTLDVDAATVSEGATGYFEYEYTLGGPGIYHYKYVSADGAVEVGSIYANTDETA